MVREKKVGGKSVAFMDFEHFSPSVKLLKKIKLYFPEEFKDRKRQMEQELILFPSNSKHSLIDIETGHSFNNGLLSIFVRLGHPGLEYYFAKIVERVQISLFVKLIGSDEKHMFQWHQPVDQVQLVTKKGQTQMTYIPSHQENAYQKGYSFNEAIINIIFKKKTGLPKHPHRVNHQIHGSLKGVCKNTIKFAKDKIRAIILKNEPKR